MKKTLVKVSLLSMMLSLMPVAMTSCKDYDNDIKEINGTTGELSSQIAALQAAIEANKESAKAAHDAAEAALQAAKEAQAKGDQAEADAQKAMAMAKAAEEAAANAKAEALAEIANQCKILNEKIGNNADAIKANADAISALLGRIEGVEKGLGAIDVEGLNNSIKELNTALQAVNVQLEALKGYEQRLNELADEFDGLKSEVEEMKGKINEMRDELGKAQDDILDLYSKVSDLGDDITDLRTLLNTLTGRVDGIDGSIGDINDDLDEIRDQIGDILSDIEYNDEAIKENSRLIGELRSDLNELSEEVSTKVQNAINTIAGVVSSRLTSVTLMPSLYVGGIPTIEFKSAQYNSLEWKNGQWVESSNTYRVSNNQTEVEYRLNPTNVGLGDIQANNLAFVSRIATTRAAEVDNDIINVVSADVESNGVLKIKAGKSNTASLNLNGNKIYTVSLKVPIAKQHLFENEPAACVYSEYTRLSEVYFTPRLHKTTAVGNTIPAHFNDSVQMYQSGMNKLVAAKVQYNKTLDLNTLVQGCEFVSPDTHTPFLSIAQLKEYGFEVSYTLATAPYNTLSADKANQQEFAQISGTTFTPGAPSMNGFATANQAAIGKQPIVHVWLKDTKNNQLVDQRYFKILITREDPTPLDYTITPNKEENLGCSNYTFFVTWDEITKQVLTQFKPNGISKEDFYHRYGAHATSIVVKEDGVEKPALAANVTDEVTLDNTGASVPVMTFTLDNTEVGYIQQGKSKTYQVTLTYTDANDLNPAVSITFNCVITNNIKNPTLGSVDKTKWVNETMLLYPIPYGSANAQAKAEYNTNILEGRFSPLVKDLLSCGMWDVMLASNTNPAMSLDYGTNAGWKTPTQASSVSRIIASIAHNAQGIAMVENETKVTLDWKAELNGLSVNTVTFANSYLQIVKPLKDPTIKQDTKLTDQSFAQTITELDKKLTLLDAFDNVVANTTDMAQNLWKYYGVESAVFANTAGPIMITDDVNGSNPRSLESLHMKADINLTTYTLTYTNEGAPLQNNCYLQIPVEIKHYWGTLKGKLYILIEHKL